MTEGPVTDEELEPLFARLRAWPVIALAVSGGSDSLALLYLYARWRSLAHASPPSETFVVTVDHRLRVESATEAETVATHARALGLRHETIVWRGDKPASGLADAAREARYRLLTARLAQSNDSPRALVTAHTQDDQAETLLMRLARGSGLTGLAGMPAERQLSATAAVTLVRPLLAIPKARLEATLAARSIAWIDDPTNTDVRYERPRLRVAQSARQAIGLTNRALARTAARLARATDALEVATSDLQRSAVSLEPAIAARIDVAVFNAAPSELRIRLLDRLLRHLGGTSPAPQLSEIERLDQRWPELPRAVTLGGCLIEPSPGAVTIYREPGRTGLPAVNLSPGSTASWDGRFELALAAAAPVPCTVRALNSIEWALVAAAFAVRKPTRAALTVPTFWIGGQSGTQLVAVPSFGIMHIRNDVEGHIPCIAPARHVAAVSPHCRATPRTLRPHVKL